MASPGNTQRHATPYEISELCAFLEHRCGSLKAAFHELDTNSCGKLRIDTFVQGVYGLGYKKNTTPIFYALDVTRQSYVTSATFVEGLRGQQVVASLLPRDDEMASSNTTRSLASVWNSSEADSCEPSERHAYLMRRVCNLEERLHNVESLRDHIAEERTERVLAQEKIQQAMVDHLEAQARVSKLEADVSQANDQHCSSTEEFSHRCLALEQGLKVRVQKLEDAAAELHEQTSLMTQDLQKRCAHLEQEMKDLVCSSLAEIRDEVSAKFEVERCQNAKQATTLFTSFREELQTGSLAERLARLESLGSEHTATCEALTDEVRRNAKEMLQVQAEFQSMTRTFTERVDLVESCNRQELQETLRGPPPSLCEELRKEIAAVTGRLATVESLVRTHVQESDMDRTMHREQVAFCNQEIGAMRGRISEIDKAAVIDPSDSAASEVSEGLRRQVVALADRLTECESTVAWQASSLQQYEIERNLHREQVVSCGQELASLKDTIGELDKAAKAVSVDPKQFAALQVKVGEWDKALPEVQAAFDAANTVGTCDELRKQLVGLVVRLGALEQKIASFSERAVDSEHFAACIQELTALQEKVAVWDSALLEGKLAGHSGDFTRQAAALHESITTIAQTLSRMQVEVSALRSEARQAKASKDPLGIGPGSADACAPARDDSGELASLRAQAQLQAAALDHLKQTIATDRAQAEARHQAFHSKVKDLILKIDSRQDPESNQSHPRRDSESNQSNSAQTSSKLAYGSPQSKDARQPPAASRPERFLQSRGSPRRARSPSALVSTKDFLAGLAPRFERFERPSTTGSVDARSPGPAPDPPVKCVSAQRAPSAPSAQLKKMKAASLVSNLATRVCREDIEAAGESHQTASTIQALLEENLRLRESNLDMSRREMETLRNMVFSRSTSVDVEATRSGAVAPSCLMPGSPPPSQAVHCAASRGTSPAQRPDPGPALAAIAPLPQTFLMQQCGQGAAARGRSEKPVVGSSVILGSGNNIPTGTLVPAVSTPVNAGKPAGAGAVAPAGCQGGGLSSTYAAVDSGCLQPPSRARGASSPLTSSSAVQVTAMSKLTPPKQTVGSAFQGQQVMAPARCGPAHRA